MLIATIGLVGMLGATPVLAQTTPQPMSCEAEIAKTEPMIAAMTDMAKKEEAMKEVDLAKSMLAKNDEAGCMTHITNAMDMTK
jgi:hypothetical protein